MLHSLTHLQTVTVLFNNTTFFIQIGSFEKKYDKGYIQTNYVQDDLCNIACMLQCGLYISMFYISLIGIYLCMGTLVSWIQNIGKSPMHKYPWFSG